MPTADSVLQQAWQMHQQGKVQQAEAIYREVVRQVPNHPAAWCYLGIALHDLKQYREAIEAYEKALKLQPEFPIALNNMGNSLRYDYRAEEADECFRKAIKLKPDYVNAHKNRGTLHVWNGNLDLAFRCYQQAMRLEPQDAELHRNLGVLNLLRGYFEEGWREYRWRWICPEGLRPKHPKPVWEGQNLQGKKLLLYAEQGLGDTFHFLRFAKIAKEMGAFTIVHGPASLTALLAHQPGIDAWIPQSVSVDQEFDYHCSLIDMADVLKVDLSNIPSQVPYIHAPSYLVDYWKDWFAKQPTGKKRIGLVWQGNKDHQADLFRSYPLSYYEPLADLPDVQLFCLQFGYGQDQVKNWKGRIPLTMLPSNIDQSSGAFMDTAAILQHLDLIITSDTSMAHLSGALGRPTWTLLSLVPDWRWLLERSDSPWYPTMKLFRQKTQGDWTGVVGEVCDALSSAE